MHPGPQGTGVKTQDSLKGFQFLESDIKSLILRKLMPNFSFFFRRAFVFSFYLETPSCGALRNKSSLANILLISMGVKFPLACYEWKFLINVFDTPSACGGAVH